MDVKAMLVVAWMLLGLWACGGVMLAVALRESDAPRNAIGATIFAAVICAIGATVCAILAAGWPS